MFDDCAAVGVRSSAVQAVSTLRVADAAAGPKPFAAHVRGAPCNCPPSPWTAPRQATVGRLERAAPRPSVPYRACTEPAAPRPAVLFPACN